MERKSIASSRRANVVLSSPNDSKKKGWLSQLQLDEIRRLVESGKNNVETQQEEQNRTGTEPIQQVIEQHIAQDEEDEGRGEENAELLIKYDNIDTVEKQNILGKIVELMKKDKLPNPQNLRRIDRVRSKEKSKLVDEVIVQISNITLYRQVTLLKTTSSSSVWGISYYPIVRNKRNKKTRRNY